MKDIAHESMPHENAAGEVMRVIDAALEAKFGHRVGIGLFVFDMGEGGFMGWSSNCLREDMAASLVEWLGTNTPEILRQAVARWTALGLLGPGAERAQ